ncbi:MAG: metallophosphoesterase [Clostridia bacterium]|nr:metallophosphoesterase [Clostridia bacterium]
MNYTNVKIPNSFNNFKILQISDFHNKKFGRNNEKIINKITKEKPDVIFITGDTIDCHHTDTLTAYSFINSVSKIAPTYLISGNHEHTIESYKDFIDNYEKNGAVVLEDKITHLEKGEDKITLVGIKDFKEAWISKLSDEAKKEFDKRLKKLLYKFDKNEFRILLSHRPELIDVYQKYKPDLVFTGHAHGGQFRFLFIKGFMAPGQGFFPKYTAGRYDKENVTMIVSRGLGNSVIPFRIFNRPELVVVNLKNR